MANNVHVSAVRRKAMVDTITAASSSGILRIYSGSQPADADASLGAAVILAELTMNATAFNAPAAVASTTYTLTANAITPDSSANASGTPSFYRLFDSAGTTPIMDGTVGVGAGFDLSINASPITAGAAVSATSFTPSMAA